MTKTQELKFSLSIVITILLITASVVAAHFVGIASAKESSKEYTDKSLKDIKLELMETLKSIRVQVIENGKMIIRLETKIEK